MPFNGSFVGVYTGFVNNYIETYITNGTADKIMRRAVEKQIMEVINKADLPLNIKLAWYASIILYDIFSAYWAGKQQEHKLAKKQIMRYQLNYSMIWKIDQCELSHDGEDSGEEEDVESVNEGAGDSITTNAADKLGHCQYTNNGSDSESSTSSDDNEYEMPTKSFKSALAKDSAPAPGSVAKKVWSTKPTTDRSAGRIVKKAGITKAYVPYIYPGWFSYSLLLCLQGTERYSQKDERLRGKGRGMRDHRNPSFLQDICIFCSTRLQFASASPTPRIQRRFLRSSTVSFRPPAQAAAAQIQEEYTPSHEEVPRQSPCLGEGGWGKASFSVELTPEEVALKQNIQRTQQQTPKLVLEGKAQTRPQPMREAGNLRYHKSKEHIPELLGEESSFRLPLDWDCERCQAVNDRNRGYCQNCNRSKQGSEVIQWRCPSCGWHNQKVQSRCNKCNSFHVEDRQMTRIAQQWKHVSCHNQHLAPEATPEDIKRREWERKIDEDRTRRLEQTKDGRFVAFRPSASQVDTDRVTVQTSQHPPLRVERPPVASSTRYQKGRRDVIPRPDRKQSDLHLGRVSDEIKAPFRQRRQVATPVADNTPAPSYIENLQQDARLQSANSSSSSTASKYFGAGWGWNDGAVTALSEAEKYQRPPQEHQPVIPPAQDSTSPVVNIHRTSISQTRPIPRENHAARSPQASKQPKATSAADISWLQSIDPSYSSPQSKRLQGSGTRATSFEGSKESGIASDDISWLEATSSRPSSKAVDRDRERASERSARKAWKAELAWKGPQPDYTPSAAPSYYSAADDQYAPGGHGHFQPGFEDRPDLIKNTPKPVSNQSPRLYNETTHRSPEPTSTLPQQGSSKSQDTLSDINFATSMRDTGTSSAPYHRSREARTPRHIRHRDEELDYDLDEDPEDSRQRRREQRKKEKVAQKRAIAPTPVHLPEYISVGNLARVLRVRVEDFSKKMRSLGFEETNSDHVLDSENAGLIAAEFNFEPVVDMASKTRDLQARPPAEDKSLLPPRPPIVTIMGHVDHGKTTLLDYLRKSSVAASEHGGITQHIGAFSVPMPGGRHITFLDTPGHAAFLSMRQRGANVTDIVILVVAADDSVKPQTIEAIKHAQAAKVPMVVAINKIDKEDKNIDRVKQDLARYGVDIEDFGGDTQVVCVSGKTGQGLDELEDATVALADIIDMRAEVDGQAEGWVLEATTKKAGRVATVLVKRGTIRRGDIIVAGSTWAKLRTLRNEAGVQVHHAGPGIPVEVDGWKDQPNAGDEVLQTTSEQQAKSAVDFRLAKAEKEQMAADMDAVNEARRLEQEKRGATESASSTSTAGTSVASTTVDPQSSILTNNNTNITLPIILKADVSGSLEACLNAITALGTSTVHPQVLRSAVGPISESDISLAASSGAQIVNFNQATTPEMMRLAERESVKLVEENVIYRLTDLVRGALEALLPVKTEVKVLGEAEVVKGFEVGIGGRKTVWVAGCRVRNGVIGKNQKVKVLRGGEGGEVVFEGQLISLKNLKKDITEARKGMECGMSFENWSDFKEGDQVQSFEEKEVKQHL
ncbi:MAG: hypothetical protein Q9213_001356 [Squamulea squamosa]